MDLQTFVGESIRQILLGIKDAQEFGKTMEPPAQVNPEVSNWPKDAMRTGPIGHLVQSIEFDVAVTTSESSAREGSAGLRVWGVGAEGEGKRSRETENVSRIRFSVPVALPRYFKPKSKPAAPPAASE